VFIRARSFVESPIPEPGAIALFGLGILGVGGAIIRRRRRAA